MTNELKILLQRTEEKHGKNFTEDNIYDTINESLKYDMPSWLRKKYIELEEELNEYLRMNNFPQSSE